MSQIVLVPVRELDPGDAIVESQGRIMFRLPDDVLLPWARRAGVVAVCDTSGNPMIVDGHTEVTGIRLDRFEPIMTPEGQIVSTSRWQASVN
jgi:hypothetical protein